MDDVTARFWSDLIGRLAGPMTLRFILQPTMSGSPRTSSAMFY